MGGAAIISSPQRKTPDASFDAAAAETRFAHIAGGKQIPYSDVDNALILRALQRQADVVRLTPVVLPNGTVLETEVRFGAHAVSDRVRKPPATGDDTSRSRDPEHADGRAAPCERAESRLPSQGQGSPSSPARRRAHAAARLAYKAWAVIS